MQPIATRAGISQNIACQIMQAEHLIQFPEQQQTTIRTDL